MHLLRKWEQRAKRDTTWAGWGWRRWPNIMEVWSIEQPISTLYTIIGCELSVTPLEPQQPFLYKLLKLSPKRVSSYKGDTFRSPSVVNRRPSKCLGMRSFTFAERLRKLYSTRLIVCSGCRVFSSVCPLGGNPSHLGHSISTWSEYFRRSVRCSSFYPVGAVWSSGSTAVLIVHLPCVGSDLHRHPDPAQCPHNIRHGMNCRSSIWSMWSIWSICLRCGTLDGEFGRDGITVPSGRTGRALHTSDRHPCHHALKVRIRVL